MTTLLLTLLVFATAMIAMAVGVMLTGRRLQGSCGGLASGACVCKAQGIIPEQCPRKQQGSLEPAGLAQLRPRAKTQPEQARSGDAAP